MQNSGGKGVILVSFGTVVGDLTGMDEEVLNVMAETFSKLQEKVIWKLKLKGRFDKFNEAENHERRTYTY